MPAEKTSPLERARTDIAEGRPDLARDRLTGYLYTLHQREEYNEEAYSLLGDAYFAMKDFPRAAAAWLLTEREDTQTAFALEAFRARYGTKDLTNIRRAVKPRAPSEAYPPKVRERLMRWDYRFIPYRSRKHPRKHLDDKLEPETPGIRPIEAGCLMLVVMAALFVAYYFYARIFAGR